MSCDGWAALPRGATGLSAVCDCGISWSYSLTIFLNNKGADQPVHPKSAQHLCYSLIGKYHISTCSKRNFHFLASLCSWAIWFGYDLVRNPEDQFSRIETHIMILLQIVKASIKLHISNFNHYNAVPLFNKWIWFFGMFMESWILRVSCKVSVAWRVWFHEHSNKLNLLLIFTFYYKYLKYRNYL